MPPTYTIRNYTGPRHRSFNDPYGTLLDHAKRRPPTDTIGTTTQVHDADASTTYGTLVDHAKRRPPTHTIGTTQVHDANAAARAGELGICLNPQVQVYLRYYLAIVI